MTEVNAVLALLILLPFSVCRAQSPAIRVRRGLRRLPPHTHRPLAGVAVAPASGLTTVLPLSPTREAGLLWPELLPSSVVRCRSQPAGPVCCGGSEPVYTWTSEVLWRKGDSTATRRERDRAPPLPGQAFIASLGTFHGGWASFTTHGLTAGD